MSSASTPNDSPVAPIQPMHNPSQAAHVVVPQAPLGNATNGMAGAPTMGMKAFLAKKMANNPKFTSPTDSMVTPVTQKLNAAKQKRFEKGAKPTGKLFLDDRVKDPSDEQLCEGGAEILGSQSPVVPAHEDTNPFE